MKKVVRLLKRILQFFVKAFGYLVLVLIVVFLLTAFVWYPIKVAGYESEDPVHLPQKQEYLKQLSEIKNQKDSMPNVVIILFDDLGYGDLSSYGNKLINTPNIDSVAAHGVRFTNFYSSSPVCTPSRAGLLTGRLPIRTRAESVYFPTGSTIANFRAIMGNMNELPQDEILLPEILKAAGYKTGMLGKWHLGDLDGHLPNDFGFDDYYGVHYSNDMLPLHIYRNKDIEIEDKTVMADGGRSHTDHEDNIKVTGLDQSRLTELYTQEADKFIGKNKNEPFFLYFAHSFPHVPHYASKIHKGKSAGGLYGDVVEDLDRSVGAVMRSLEKNGLLNNTLVIITSDNGADVNGSAGPLRGKKQQTYEGGQRVPLIVQWQGHLPENVVTDELGMNIDFLPTILDILDLPFPTDRKIDGKNIFPVFEGGESPHDYLYYTKNSNGQIQGVRNAHYKYHIGSNQAMPIFGNIGFVRHQKPQLNDLDQDMENHNLIEKYPEIAEELEKVMKDKVEDLDLENNKRGWLE